MLFGRCQGLGEEGVEQAAAGGGGVVKARLQLVTQGYQVIDFGDG
jgi:hypothetical protein